jgi:twitching motility protein PilT
MTTAMDDYTHTDPADHGAAHQGQLDQGRPLSSLDDLLEEMVSAGASDLHLSAGSPPQIRVNGSLQRLGDEPLRVEDTERLLYNSMTTEQQKRLEAERQVDFSYVLPGVSRFRANVYFQRDSISGAYRAIPHEIKTIEELKLPEALHALANRPRGLVLVTGPTGSGKSTTLAAVIDQINRTRSDHIITVEDPIEFLHHHGGCLVNQREIGVDATGFADSLRGALRQDPDVILVGEMRDLETIATALTAAETGHLVFGTLHTQDAAATIDRVIDAFPAAQQNQVRVQLAAVLQGVVSQALLPTIDGRGRAAAIEILIPDDACRNLIRQSKVEQIYSIMQTSSSKGMQTLEQSLAALVLAGTISRDVAMACTSRPRELEGLLPDSPGMADVAPLRRA